MTLPQWKKHIIGRKRTTGGFLMPQPIPFTNRYVVDPSINEQRRLIQLEVKR